MPLRVKCPNGCVMRVPNNRAGKSARCPGCKKVVVVPFPPKGHQPNVLLEAPFASSSFADTSTTIEQQSDESQSSPIHKNDDLPVPEKRSKTESESSASEPKPVEPTPQEPKRVETEPVESATQLDPSKSKRTELERTPATLKSTQNKQTPKAQPKRNKSVAKPDSSTEKQIRKSDSKERVAQKSPRPQEKRDSKELHIAAVLSGVRPKGSSNSKQSEDEIQIDVGAVETPVVNLSELAFDSNNSITSDEIQLESGPTESSGMLAIEKRAKRATEDRITLTRFFAGFLVVVGLINFAPAIWCWYSWSQQDVDFMIPRWIYLQIFVAILHLVYAVLLLQVPDWSTLRSIAVVMLVFAFVFGLFSMGLLTSGGSGVLALYLQVPNSFAQQACIWCVAMLCLATLASYLAGRESNAWQRTEKLLSEIVSKEASA